MNLFELLGLYSDDLQQYTVVLYDLCQISTVVLSN